MTHSSTLLKHCTICQWTLILILFMCSVFSTTVAQDPCGFVPDPNPSGPPENPANCFSPLTPADIFEDCTPVYININAHVFVDNDCASNVQHLPNTTQLGAYHWVENYIEQCNTALANNPVQWQLNAPAACMPIRYVLNGVYMHCKTGSNWQNIGTGYHVNSATEVNAYFTSASPSSGLAFGNYVVIGTTSVGVFNHEMGHTFGLNHAYNDKDFPTGHCDDTNPFNVSWDKNCNGVLAPYYHNNILVREENYNCWMYIGNFSSDWETIPEANKNYNNLYDCDVAEPCGISPCCDWGNISNNTMSDNQFQDAFTACQSQFWLENTHSMPTMCNFVEAVGGACAPPAAFITQTAKDKANTSGYCTEHLVMQASFNEVRHKLDIMLTGSQVNVYSTGWVEGEIKNLIFSTNASLPPPPDPSFFWLLLSTGTPYTATLTVENACNDQDSYVYTFTTPTVSECNETIGEAPDPGSVLNLSVSPNPTTGTVNINFDGNAGEAFTVKSVNLLDGNITTIMSNYSAVGGSNAVSVNVSSLPMGNYALSVQSAQKLYQGHFIKL